METKTTTKIAAKMGLYSTIMIIVGSVISVGFFFKNISVFAGNDYNAIAILFSWLMAIALVFCLALSFSQIMTCKTKDNLNLGSWAEQYCGKKFGNYVKILQPIGYYIALSFGSILFAGETMLNMIFCIINKGDNVGVINFKYQGLTIFFIGFSLIIIFSLLNYWSKKIANDFGSFLSFFKFLPIFLVIILGIVASIANAWQQNGLWLGKYWNSTKQEYVDASKNIFTIKTITVIPSILFTFEGYLAIGNRTNQIEGSKKNISWVLALIIMLISFTYLLLTIICICLGFGNIYDMMNICFSSSQTLSMAMNIIFSSFLFISVLSICNGRAICAINSIKQIISQDLLFLPSKLKNLSKNKPALVSMIYYFFLLCFMGIGILVLTIFFNSDQIISCIGNVNILVFYLIYGIIVFFSFINEFTKKVETTHKIKWFKFFSLFGALGAILLSLFCCVYQYILIPILQPNEYNITNSWCLFVDCNHSMIWMKKLKNWQGMIIFWSLFVFFLNLPIINNWLIKFSSTNKQKDKN